MQAEAAADDRLTGCELELESARRLLLAPAPAQLAMLTATLERARGHLAALAGEIAAQRPGDAGRDRFRRRLRPVARRLERLAMLLGQASALAEARLAARRAESGYRADGSAGSLQMAHPRLVERA